MEHTPIVQHGRVVCKCDDYNCASLDAFRNRKITMDNAGDTEYFVESLRKLQKLYGFVALADYKELIGVSSTWEDEKYGWTDLTTVSVTQEDGLFIILLPEPSVL